jgi:hypothetical protein
MFPILAHETPLTILERQSTRLATMQVRHASPDQDDPEQNEQRVFEL